MQRPVGTKVDLTPSPSRFVGAILAAALATPGVVVAGGPLKHAMPGFPAPAWYEAHRIQFHTRFSFRKYDANEKSAAKGDSRATDWIKAFETASTKLASIGASVLTRHVKSGRESPPWLSGAKNQALLQAILADAKSSHMHLIGYIWDTGDDALAAQHPDWRCLDQRGRAQNSKRSPFLDFATPYGATFGGWLKKLDELGFAGAYLDETHYPRAGCNGSALEAAYRARAGTSGTAAGGTPFASPFLLHQADELAATVSRWNATIGDPAFALIVSVGPLPTLVNPQMSTELARASIPKTEFKLVRRTGQNLKLFQRFPELLPTRPSEDARFATGMSLLATVSGTLPHVWIHGLSTEDQLLRAVGSIVSNAGVANVDLGEDLLAAKDNRDTPAANGLTPATLSRFIKLDALASPAFVGKHLPAYAAVHFSPAARNRAANVEQAWIDVAGPVTVAFDRLTREGLPVAVIDDRILAEGDLSSYRYILTPNESGLTDAQRSNIAGSGARLIALPSLPLEPGAAARALGAALAPVIDNTAEAPGRVRVSDPAARTRLWMIPPKKLTWCRSTGRRQRIGQLARRRDARQGTRPPAPRSLPSRSRRRASGQAGSAPATCWRAATRGTLPV